MTELKVFTTTQKEHFRETVLRFEDHPGSEMLLLKVYPEEERQEVLGFGGALTESSAYVWSRMSRVNQEKLMKLYFGPEGNRYNFCRTHIQSCDFSLGNRSYVEEGDESLSTFSIGMDRVYLIPFIQAAQKKEPGIRFLASPWSPPPFMKTNKEMNHGGRLRKEYYDAWARLLVKYVQSYEKEGILIDWMTLQNEPEAVQTWDSCIFSAEEEREFACGYLRKRLDEAGYAHIKLGAWDHNTSRIIERTSGIFTDAKADQAIAGIAFHWYSGDHFDALEAVRQRYPQKTLIFSEGCVEYSRHSKKTPCDHAEMYAHALIGNFNAGMNAFIDWNIILDDEGGPNHARNFCDAPVMCDVERDSFEVKLSYYYIGHFSRFVRPGAKRLLTSRYTHKLECCAFRNPDGQTVMIVMNASEESQIFMLASEENVCRMEMEPHSIRTICW